jgi:hypothetical protein
VPHSNCNVQKISTTAIHFCQVSPLLHPSVSRLDSLPYLPYRGSGTVLSSRCPSSSAIEFPSPTKQTNFINLQGRVLCCTILSLGFRSVQKYPTKASPTFLSVFAPSVAKPSNTKNAFRFPSRQLETLATYNHTDR